MFLRLGRLVTRHWVLAILFWIVLLIGLRWAAPRWDDITHDGDLAYLPASMPSVVGQKLLAEAFPDNRAKSQIVIIVARDQGRLDQDDIVVAYDLARRFLNLAGAARLGRLLNGDPEDPAARREAEAAAEALDDAIYFDQAVARHGQQDPPAADQDPSGSPGAPSGSPGQGPASQRPPDADQADPDQAEPGSISGDTVAGRWKAAYHNRALLAEWQNDPRRSDEERQPAAAERRRGAPPSPDLDPDSDSELDLPSDRDSAATGGGHQVLPADAADLPLLDVWTWRDRLVGEKLVSPDQAARLLVLQLSNEFMATDNVRVLRRVEEEVEAVRRSYSRPGLRIGISGSAAVGGDMLRAAAASIRNTEWCTIVLVVLILVLIYRSPLLVAIPLLTITVSLLISTSLVALLTQLGQLPGFHWWELKIFTTTKIFVVVILFGAGTDYCLFLIARYREELRQADGTEAAMARTLSGVGDALAASALTTIVGLSTMYLADFGKFRYSGPVIGLSLAVTLLVCITLTPALLLALGRLVFWPAKPDLGAGPAGSATTASAAGRRGRAIGQGASIWDCLARRIVARPGLILAVSLLVMLPWAWHGFRHFTPLSESFGDSRVTYDFLNSLADDLPSKQGAALLRRHFPVGEAGPLTILLHQPGQDFESAEAGNRLRKLVDELYLPGVRAVRSIVDPLGDYEPGEKPGFLSQRGKRYRILRAHPRTRETFVSQAPGLAGSVTRLEVILEHDPFSREAIGALRQVDETLRKTLNDPASSWDQARFAYAGTTAGIRDLRAVTQSDNLRIEILVVLAVLAVLLVILRRPLVCVYMVASVLLSFYVTVGISELFFRWAYGPSYAGLDWKVPLFLFVILVAVGQDYNVYLATRVFEEQQRHGPFGGLRRAVVRTGGIITSCGLIMAGTFLSMTSGAWPRLLLHWLPDSWLASPSWSFLLAGGGSAEAGGLRGIVEMGFALALGVLLDTFVVRTVMVPAFLSLLARWQLRRQDLHKNRATRAQSTGMSGPDDVIRDFSGK